MGIVINILMAIEVITALFLITIILMQRSKSGGGLGALAGGQTEEVFGSSASSVLTKTTIALSIIFFAVTLSLAVLQGNALKDKQTSVVDSVAIESDAAIADDDAKEVDDTVKKLTGSSDVKDLPKPVTTQEPTTENTPQSN